VNPTWHVMAAAPVEADERAGIVWTGSELFVGGASYDPASDRWATLPRSPLSARQAPAVWTGREVIIWGGADATDGAAVHSDGAAYDPASRAWRRIAPSPLTARSRHQMIWTGKEVVVWGGITMCCPVDSTVHEAGAASYDPVADRWRALPDVPQPWSGDGGDAIGFAHDGTAWIWRHGTLGRLSLDGAWTTFALEPAAAPAEDERCWVTGAPFAQGVAVMSSLFIWTSVCDESNGHRLDLGTKQWADLGPGPWGIYSRNLVADGEHAYGFWSADGQDAGRLHLMSPDGTWQDLPPPPANSFGSWPAVVGTGDGAVIWGGSDPDGKPKRAGAVVRLR
jgi:hypothetical protein